MNTRKFKKVTTWGDQERDGLRNQLTTWYTEDYEPNGTEISVETVEFSEEK